MKFLLVPVRPQEKALHQLLQSLLEYWEKDEHRQVTATAISKVLGVHRETVSKAIKEVSDLEELDPEAKGKCHLARLTPTMLKAKLPAFDKLVAGVLFNRERINSAKYPHSRRTLCELFGCSDSQLGKALKRLKSIGWLHERWENGYCIRWIRTDPPSSSTSKNDGGDAENGRVVSKNDGPRPKPMSNLDGSNVENRRGGMSNLDGSNVENRRTHIEEELIEEEGASPRIASRSPEADTVEQGKILELLGDHGLTGHDHLSEDAVPLAMRLGVTFEDYQALLARHAADGPEPLDKNQLYGLIISPLKIAREAGHIE